MTLFTFLFLRYFNLNAIKITRHDHGLYIIKSDYNNFYCQEDNPCTVHWYLYLLTTFIRMMIHSTLYIGCLVQLIVNDEGQCFGKAFLIVNRHLSVSRQDISKLESSHFFDM